MEFDFITIMQNFGFPVVVALVLLWDKVKSNGLLVKAIENNTLILTQIKSILEVRNE